MPKSKLTEDDLKREVEGFRELFPALQDDELFIVWFMKAFVTNDEQLAASSLSGGSHDKGVDAVLFDDKAQHVYVIQGKYRAAFGKKAEKRSDIISFAQIANKITGSKSEFDNLVEGSAPGAFERLTEARKRVLGRGYHLHLYYATVGACSGSLEEEAVGIVRNSQANARMEIFAGRRIILLLRDYIDGVAPPVPSVELEMESGGGISLGGILQRYDRSPDIDSWIFPMSGVSMARIYDKTGDRIFARNIRGFLGSTAVNRSMQETLKSEPEFFWYYNNGITIICDSAEKRTKRGKDILYVQNPQIINGQQTTRTLHQMHERDQLSAKASVVVRVIRVPREVGDDQSHFESLVSSIVAATNWQNAIKPSDLMSNDGRQIEIERALRKVGYLYLRKRESKSKAREATGAGRFFTVRKEDVARAVAACDLDPLQLRLGKEMLFEEDLYKVVFPNSDPDYYLTRYWLLKRVTRVAKGFPERAYAKWLVTNFLWSNLSSLLRTKALRTAFRAECERGGGSLDLLQDCINSTFNASLAFFRRERGKGPSAKDVSSFFRSRKGLHQEFRAYWSSGSNRFRKTFERKWLAFAAELAEVS